MQNMYFYSFVQTIPKELTLFTQIFTQNIQVHQGLSQLPVRTTARQLGIPATIFF